MNHDTRQGLIVAAVVVVILACIMYFTVCAGDASAGTKTFTPSAPILEQVESATVNPEDSE